MLSRSALALLPASLRPAARSFLTYLATLPSSAPTPARLRKPRDLSGRARRYL
ncbi:hypothetical protein [Salinicola tamaricis]|uniref:hypothetical protein n=1 Tax=Salinicola tamaricis TaxID=1771309 RepID=UPI0013ED7933|nr:hypothetical protein [Salinicola tamaricis]